MGKHSDDICVVCGVYGKDFTFVSWVVHEDGKGGTVCPKDELKVQNDYLDGAQ